MSDRPEMGPDYGDLRNLRNRIDALEQRVSRVIDALDRLTNELERDRRVRPFVDAAMVEDMLNRLRKLEKQPGTYAARDALNKAIADGKADG